MAQEKTDHAMLSVGDEFEVHEDDKKVTRLTVVSGLSLVLL